MPSRSKPRPCPWWQRGSDSTAGRCGTWVATSWCGSAWTTHRSRQCVVICTWRASGSENPGERDDGNGPASDRTDEFEPLVSQRQSLPSNPALLHHGRSREHVRYARIDRTVVMFAAVKFHRGALL